MTEDDWFTERYQAALLADHEKGHPGRAAPVDACQHCAVEGRERNGEGGLTVPLKCQRVPASSLNRQHGEQTERAKVIEDALHLSRVQPGQPRPVRGYLGLWRGLRLRLTRFGARAGCGPRQVATP